MPTSLKMLESRSEDALVLLVVVVVINLFSELIIAFPEKRSVQYVQYN